MITAGLHIPLQNENSIEILTFTFRSHRLATPRSTLTDALKPCIHPPPVLFPLLLSLFSLSQQDETS